MATQTEKQTLRREVGWYGSFAMGYADVGADIYVAIGLVALFAGGARPLEDKSSGPLLRLASLSFRNLFRLSRETIPS